MKKFDKMPVMLKELAIAASEREQKKKQEDFMKFMASIHADFKDCDEIIIKPPAGEEYILSWCKIQGKETLVLSGGMGYEIFPEIWTIRFPQKTAFEKEWVSSLISYESIASDRVAFYQSSFTLLDDTGNGLIFGGVIKIGKGAGLESINEATYSVDLNTLQAKQIKSKDFDEPGPGHLRFHSAGIIDGCLIIVGGVNSREEPSTNVWKLKVSKT